MSDLALIKSIRKKHIKALQKAIKPLLGESTLPPIVNGIRTPEHWTSLVINKRRFCISNEYMFSGLYNEYEAMPIEILIAFSQRVVKAAEKALAKKFKAHIKK